MKVFEREVIAKRVVHFYLQYSDLNKIKTVKDFVQEGEKRDAMYRIPRGYEDHGSIDFLNKSGQTLSSATASKTKKVIKLCENTNASVRDVV